MSIANKPIYPASEGALWHYAPGKPPEMVGGTGITLIQYYAGLAMQGIIGPYGTPNTPQCREIVAEMSVCMAKDLIAVLEREYKQ